MVEECARLFSQHYGRWSSLGPRPGHSIALSPSSVKKECLFSSYCGLVAARLNDVLVGHAFYTIFPFYSSREKKPTMCLWITQLVVHKDYRHQGIATRLCESALSAFSHHIDTCGLASSHPYAVRALEKASGGTAMPSPDLALALVEASAVPYLQNRAIYIDEANSLINTQFHVDQSDLVEIIQKEGDNWRLGKHHPGMEFLAIIKTPSHRPERSLALLSGLTP
jgi:GNAT superfamily N-acetyltransferase